MKTYLKLIFVSIFSITVTAASAQSEGKSNNTGWPVSKGVQLYSNKSLATFKPIKIKSVGTPSYVQSKGVHRSKTADSSVGNIPMTGTPAWVISKPVNLISR
jgi:hypothetical protein